MTPFSEIYERAASKIEDPDLALLPEEDLEDMFHGWLMSAISMRKMTTPASRRCRSTSPPCVTTFVYWAEKTTSSYPACARWITS